MSPRCKPAISSKVHKSFCIGLTKIAASNHMLEILKRCNKTSSYEMCTLETNACGSSRDRTNSSEIDNNSHRNVLSNINDFGISLRIRYPSNVHKQSKRNAGIRIIVFKTVGYEIWLAEDAQRISGRVAD